MVDHDPRLGRRPNRLAAETSPYLLQHAHNPVDWRPWGADALDRARAEDKPVFLSIGYAACHWCHVMERESFEDERVAAFLNAHFVPVKVDREERPDVDEIYMAAVQLMTGSGGWPLTVFLTPQGEPFFGGTYFPPDARHGRPGLLDLLRRIRDLWAADRERIRVTAAEMAEHLRRAVSSGTESPGAGRLGRREIERAIGELAARFDARWGGFGGAPKFPPHGACTLLLRENARTGSGVLLEMAERTLEAMALGGIFDAVGGGFARYSTDERWLVPHFEKMLYDQALLVPVYADAWLVTGKPRYRRVAEETCAFVRRELTGDGGGLFSSLDADSEGGEGRFYVWTPGEIAAVLGDDDGQLFCRVYGISEAGNFEGKSVPNLLGGTLSDRAREMGVTEARLESVLAPLRFRVLEARERRVRPETDDKVLSGWNGLMISAFSKAYQAFGRPEDLRAARGAADFVLGNMVRDGGLLAAWREGRGRIGGFLDDYAFVARGLLDLYESCFDRGYLHASERLAREILARFEDVERGGFFSTALDHERLLVRTRSVRDGALPAGSGVAAEALLRLATHLRDAGLRAAGERTLAALRGPAERFPSAFAAALVAADFAEGGVREIAVAGRPEDPGTAALVAAAHARYLPNRVIAAAEPGPAADGLPLLEGKTRVGGRPAAYVCVDSTCGPPLTDPAALAARLDRPLPEDPPVSPTSGPGDGGGA